MALTKNLSLTNNFGTQSEFPNAYLKIKSIEGDKQELKVIVAHMTEQNGRVILETLTYFNPSLDGSNFIAQAYAHLKTLPDFAGATDC